MASSWYLKIFAQFLKVSCPHVHVFSPVILWPRSPSRQAIGQGAAQDHATSVHPQQQRQVFPITVRGAVEEHLDVGAFGGTTRWPQFGFTQILLRVYGFSGIEAGCFGIDIHVEGTWGIKFKASRKKPWAEHGWTCLNLVIVKSKKQFQDVLYYLSSISLKTQYSNHPPDTFTGSPPPHKRSKVCSVTSQLPSSTFLGAGMARGKQDRG